MSFDNFLYQIKKTVNKDVLFNTFSLFSPDAPSSPRDFNVSKVGPDSVTLNWKSPSSDGGSKVTGYVVRQKRGTEGDWEEVATLKAFDTSYKVPKLQEDQEYFFSLTALNKKGPGETSQLDTAVVPKRPPGNKSSTHNSLLYYLGMALSTCFC